MEYSTLSVRKEDLKKFKQLAKRFDMKQIDFFRRVVKVLEKRLAK